ncbi:MAG: TonB-dependent receptor, partial [Bryobacteraceae bacterium]
SIYGGVYWDAQELLLEDVERIEVLRGPSATAWGPRAANGVVNIITKKAAETQGGYLEAGGGGHERVFGGARFGGKLGSRAHYRVSGQMLRRHHTWREDSGDGADGWNAERTGVRLDWYATERDEVNLSGNAYDTRTGQNAGLPFPLPYGGAAVAELHGHGGDALAHWRHDSTDGAQTDVQFSQDWAANRGWRWDENVYNLDFDLRRRTRSFGGHSLQYGINYVQTRCSLTDFTDPGADSVHRSPRRFSVFLDDEWALTDALSLSLGGRIEHNTYTGIELQPEIRLAWEPKRGNTLWFATARGARPPTPLETDARGEIAQIGSIGGVPVAMCLADNPGIRSETVRAVEAGYRADVTAKVSVDLAAYWNSYAGLRSVALAGFSPGAPARLYVKFDDRDSGRVTGVESNVEWRPRNNLRLVANHTWTRLVVKEAGGPRLPVGAGGPGSVPTHEGQLRSYLTLPRKVTFDTALYVSGPLERFSLPAHARLDARLAWGGGEHTEFSVTGSELQGGSHIEFYSEFSGRPGAFGRSLYGMVAWRF